MNLQKNGLREKNFLRKLQRQLRRADNKELRRALWEVRNKLRSNQPEEKDVNWKIYLREQAISTELKRRELLEWALKTRTELESGD